MALSANAQLNHYLDQGLREFPVGAAVHIYAGGNAGLDPAGYLKPFEPGDFFCGISYQECDNSLGAAGAKKCRVYVQRDFELTITGVALTDADAPVFATADDAQGLTGHPDAYMGKVVHYLAANTAIVRLREYGKKPPNGVGSIDIDIDFAKLNFTEVLTAGNEVLVAHLLRMDAIGAGILTGAGIAPDPTTGEVKMLLDNDNEAQNLSIETPQIFNITKGITAEFVGRNKTAGGAATDDFDFGIASLAGGLTDTERADMNAATAGLKSALFHIDTNALHVLCSSDDNVSPVAAVDTLVDNSLTVNSTFKLIGRVGGGVEVWIAGARVLATSTFSVSAAGLFALIANLEKSTGTGVPEVRFRRMRIAGAIA